MIFAPKTKFFDLSWGRRRGTWTWPAMAGRRPALRLAAGRPKLTERDISSDFSELISRPWWIFPGGARYKLSKNPIQNLPNWDEFEVISQIEVISM